MIIAVIILCITHDCICGGVVWVKRGLYSAHGNASIQVELPFNVQAASLRRLAVYFDVGTKLWQPEKDWNKLPLEAWDAMFRPGIAEQPPSTEGKGEIAGRDTGPGLPPASYVLKPVDGRLLYLRRGKDVRKSEEEAVQEADVQLESLSLHLSSKT